MRRGVSLLALGGTLASGAVACVSEPVFTPVSGAPVNEDSYEVDLTTAPDGPPPFLGATDLVVAGGKLVIAGAATQGFTSLPFALRNKGGKFDATITVTAEVPYGGQIVVGRGRLRDPKTQAGVGVVFAPSEDATGPSGFAVGLALGSFPDPRDGKVRELGCGGANGQTYISKSAFGNAVAASTLSAFGYTFAMQEAPQLVSLADEVKQGAVHLGPLAPTSSKYTLTFRKTGDGEGTLEARQGDTLLFGGPYAVSKSKNAGVSFGCKVSYLQCVSFCTLQGGLVGAELFGGACTVESCANNKTDVGDPEPLDFQNSEACRQTGKLADSCSAPLSATSATAVSYRVGVNEAFKDAADSNEFLIQLVRAKSTGASPVVTAIKVTR